MDVSAPHNGRFARLTGNHKKNEARVIFNRSDG